MKSKFKKINLQRNIKGGTRDLFLKIICSHSKFRETIPLKVNIESEKKFTLKNLILCKYFI